MLGTRFWVGDWLVEPNLNRISRGDDALQLEPRAVEVLVYLADRAGEVVSRSELQDAIWETEFVTYNAVAGRISELRKAFGDDARPPRYIETIPKRGYRLIAEVSFGDGGGPGADVLARTLPERADERSPYPGLAPFTEADAAHFFGREAEIAALWRTITGRRLLAVIGPSGAGKSSLLRAGVLPRAPQGWGAVVCAPGEAPSLALAQALAADLAGESDEVQQLLRFQDPDVALAAVARWRGRWDEALIVVDQFEELFTLNPPETRARFAALLRRLVDAADVHVVLAMRDDFLFECHGFRELEPVFREITPIGQPDGVNLRRAIVEPAARHGYTLEDELLVDEMVGEVEEERGALPLLAFAVSRLWELRDRERRLLTREAYEKIGGVGGALAQHAEGTMDCIGSERIAIARELFRNLVTAEGTRAVRDVDELLSVFTDSQRESAEVVLRALIDARLLTSYELREADEEPTRKVEIIHESLLASWPRLVRWQTQDADAAQLRDQLRQAARTWHEHHRSDDLLWTGSAFREYALWRERYPGGLTGLEGAFATAMVSLATRRKRRRRIVTAGALVLAIVVAAVFGTLWHRSAQETRRAEAAKLLAIAEARLGEDPTEALALTTASLAVTDTREAREFVMRALWAAPPALELEIDAESHLRFPSFSPDGRHVAVAGLLPEVRVWSENGQGPIRLAGHSTSLDGVNAAMWPSNDLLVTGRAPDAGFPGIDDRVRVWSMPEGKLLRVIDFGSPSTWKVGPRRLLAETELGAGTDHRIELRSWGLPDGPEELLDRSSAAELGGGREESSFDAGEVTERVVRGRWMDAGVVGSSGIVSAPDGSGWVVARGNAVSLIPFGGRGPERLLEVLEGDVSVATFGNHGVITLDEAGSARLWSFAGGEPSRVWAIRRPATAASALPDWGGRRAARLGPARQSIQVSELEGLPGARPLELRRSGWWYYPGVAFHPGGRWLAATTHVEKRLTLWPLARSYPSVVEAYDFPADRREIAFSPDSQWLATGFKDGGVRLIPVPGGDPTTARELRVPGDSRCARIRFDPEGQTLLVVTMAAAWVVPLDGEAMGFPVPDSTSRILDGGAISPSGARFASAFSMGEGAAELYVFDVATGALQSFALPRPDQTTGRPDGVNSLEFLGEQTLLTSGLGGLRRWDLTTGTHELVLAAEGWRAMRASRAAGIAIHWAWGTNLGPGLGLLDLATGTNRTLARFGDDVETADVDPSGLVAASGGTDGCIRVGRLDGSEPHLLPGHSGTVIKVAISPDLRWVASAGEDGTLRLWPMPDLSKPPLHTLPQAELLAKLKSLTNLRAVRDPDSDTGWTVELGPFPGWREVPTW